MQIVIVAGGGGARLWPLSTRAKPKQFIPLLNNETLLQYTYLLLQKRFNIEDIWVSTNKKYEELVLSQLPDFDSKLLIMEPEKRDTFAAETAACALIASFKGEDEVVSFVPCDDYWPNQRSEENFLDALIQLEEAAQNNHIALLGIKPTYPSIEYGYIELDVTTWRSIGQINKVVSFLEKPNLNTAEVYLDTGKYLWHKHSPTFSFATLRIILSESDFTTLATLEQIFSTQSISREIYSQLPKSPIDTAVLEKTHKIVVIGLDADWEDVGSWKTLEKYLPKPEDSNIVVIDGQNNNYFGLQKKVAFVGVSNLLVIEGNAGLIIMDTQDTKNIKQVAEKFDTSNQLPK